MSNEAIENNLLEQKRKAEDELLLVEFERNHGLRIARDRKLDELKKREQLAKETIEQIMLVLEESQKKEVLGKKEAELYEQK